MASGNAPLKIKGDTTAKATLTMGSTVTQVLVSSPASSVVVGGTTTLTATPKNALGSMVLVGAATVTWKSSDPTVATVDATGLTPTVHALKAGTVTFTATFNEVEPTLNQVPVVSVEFSFSVYSTNHLYFSESIVGDEGNGLITQTNLQGGERRVIAQYNANPDVSLFVSPDGSRIALQTDTGSGSGSVQTRTVTVFDAITGVVMSRFSGTNFEMIGMTASSLYFSEFGSTAGAPSVLTQTNLQGGSRRVITSCSHSSDYNLLVSPDGSRIVLQSNADNVSPPIDTVTVFDTSTGAVASEFTGNYLDVFGITNSHLYFSESSASGSARDVLTQTNLQGGGRRILTAYSPTADTSLFISPNDTRIALHSDSTATDTVTVFSVDTGVVASQFSRSGLDIIGIDP